MPVRQPTISSNAAQDVTIIGGALTGLTFALACAYRGVRSRVLEQARTPPRGGGTLGINRELLMHVVGREACHAVQSGPFPALTGRRQAVAWRSLHNWLRRVALRYPEILLEDGVAVTQITQVEDGAVAIASDGRRFESRVIVGADGYRSLVRREIDPENTRALYAGYLLWRGLVDEAELPSSSLPQEHEETVLVNNSGYRLVAYTVAGLDGSSVVGQRQLSFTWYDPGHGRLLKTLNCINGAGGVEHSLTAANVPTSVGDRLSEQARLIWPEPWRTVIIHAIERRQVFATPVAEYFPHRLCQGSLAIIGDAAHTVSPVTGQGFIAGVKDAETLAGCLAGAVDSSDQWWYAALALYEKKRLADVQTLVLASQKWSRAFVERIRRLQTSRPCRSGAKKSEGIL